MGVPTDGDLKVWWIPQIPMKAFYWPVTTLDEAVEILNCLAQYDLFQYRNNVKGDYANAGGLLIYEDDDDGNFEWCEWSDRETGEDIREYEQNREG